MTQAPVRSSARAPLREVQLGLGLAVEAGWLFAWSAVLGGWIEPLQAEPLLPLPIVAGLLVASMLATRLAAAQRNRPDLARLAVALLGLGAAAAIGVSVVWRAGESNAPLEAGAVWLSGATAQAALLAAGLTLLAWWRGIVAGRARRTIDSSADSLRMAVGGLAVLFLFQAFAPRQEWLTGLLVGAVLLVLSAGLVGLPLAAILDERERPRHAGSPGPSIDSQWLGLLLAAIGALLLLAVVLAQIVTFERLELVLQPFAALFGAVFWALFYVIAIPLGLLLELLIWLLRLVLDPDRQRPLAPLEELSWLEELREQAEQGGQDTGPLLTILGLLAATVVVSLLAWLLARAARGWSERRSDDEVEEVRDWVWSWATLRTSWRDRLRSLLGVRGPAQADRLAEAGLDAAETAPDGIRQLYRALLRLGARLDRRRAPDETPHEYAQALSTASPLAAGQAEVQLLTGAYVRDRYGAQPPAPATLVQARAALETLEGLAAEPDPAPER